MTHCNRKKKTGCHQQSHKKNAEKEVTGVEKEMKGEGEKMKGGGENKKGKGVGGGEVQGEEE